MSSSLKNCNYIKDDIILDSKKQQPYISQSVHYYINEINNELLNCQNIDVNMVRQLQEQINPYSYLINSDFINNNLHKSKDTFTFFIFIELLKITNIIYDIISPEEYQVDTSINIYCDTEPSDIISSIKYVNKNIKLHYTSSLKNNIDIMTFVNDNYIDDDHDIQSYKLNLLIIISHILLFQSNNGSCVIKIKDIFYKPIIDILYILSIIYNKVYIIKPLTSNCFNNERYIVCKGLTMSPIERNDLHIFIHNVINEESSSSLSSLSSSSSSDISIISNNNHSLFSNEIPYHFINKIDESNIGIAHQLLEYNDILINIIYNKLSKEKLETIKKNNLNKSQMWCDKYKISYNKITDNNIFLQHSQKAYIVVEE
jgi:hypothetical protein